MAETNQNEVLKYRPFNFEQASRGAPVGLRSDKASVRVVCWDVENDLTPIVGIVQEDKTSVKEVINAYDINGNVHGPKSHPSQYDLVMTPVGYVDGNPVFWGDKVYHKKTGAMSEVGRNWPGLIGYQLLPQYAMEPPTLQFKNRPLTIHDELWYKGPEDPYWWKVKMSDHWTTRYTPGVVTTHYGYIKDNLQRPHLLDMYSWDFPLEVSLSGKKLEVGETVWFKHNPEEKGMIVNERFIELIHKGTLKRSALTRRPWTKKNSWQAQVQVEFEDGMENPEPILLGPLFPTEHQCLHEAPALIPEGYKFLAAKVAQSYYI